MRMFRDFTYRALSGAALVLPCVLLAAEEEAAGQQDSFMDFYVQGGQPMHAIAALSFMALGFVFFFIFTLRGNVLYPKGFVQEAEDAAAEGDVEALRAICEDSDSAAARVVGSAAEFLAGDKNADYFMIRDAIEDEGSRQASILWQRIQYLMYIAVIAPMVGLLGTVWGMRRSFAGLEAGVSFVNKADALAAGVGQAMNTTLAGLVVGIGAMVFYAFFRGRVNKLIAGLEGACARVMRRFVASRKTY